MGLLRLLLAIAVIAFHSGLQVLGPLAVYSFFIMSGYAIFAGMNESKQRRLGLIKFFARRFNKLLPIYLLTCLVVTSMLIGFERWKPHSTQTLIAKSEIYRSSNVWAIAKQFVPTLTLSPWPIRVNPNVPLVPPWWSVVLELGFYLICALIVYFYKWKAKVLIIYFSITLILHLYLLKVIGQDLSRLNLYVYFSLFGTLVFFALGNITRHFSKSLKANLYVRNTAFAILISFIFVFSYIVKDPTQLIPNHPVWGYLLAVYLVSYLTVMFLLNLPQGRIMVKNDVYFANHSYGIYVWQSATFFFVNYAETQHWWPATIGFPRFIIIITLTALCSLASAKLISYASKIVRKSDRIQR